MTDIRQSLEEGLRSGVHTPETAMKAFNELTPNQIKAGKVYVRQTLEERKGFYKKDKEMKEAILKEGIPFISEHCFRGLYLCQGLTIVGAESGRAKSTTAANIVAGFIKKKKKSCLFISNEDTSSPVYDRIACVLAERSYHQYTTPISKMSYKEREVIADIRDTLVLPQVEVITGEEGKNSHDPTFIEDVISILETAALDPTVGLVVLDYLQVVTQSRNNPDKETYSISKDLGLYLKSYGQKYGIPVVCFTQLHSKTKGPTMAERVQNDKSFFNHGFLCVEVIPDFEQLNATFKIHKDRLFNFTGKETIADFDGGRYIFTGENSL